MERKCCAQSPSFRIHSQLLSNCHYQHTSPRQLSRIGGLETCKSISLVDLQTSSDVGENFIDVGQLPKTCMFVMR